MTGPPLRPRALLLDAVPEGVDLAHGVGHRAVGVDDDVGDGEPCGVVDLGVDARLRLDRIESALLDEALDLGALGRARHDDEVERVVDGGFDQERNVVDHDGVGVLGLDLRR